jgi:hypothetical protein
VPNDCRGTLVTHALPDAECTDPLCVDCVDLNHALVIPCSEVDGVCPECSSHDQVTRLVAA